MDSKYIYLKLSVYYDGIPCVLRRPGGQRDVKVRRRLRFFWGHKFEVDVLIVS